MKWIKRLLIMLLICLVILLIPTGWVTYQGYLRYVSVMAEEPLETKINEIQSKPNYTELEDLPEIYLDAVVAVEDKRFYSHFRIDLDFSYAGGSK